MEYSLSSSLVGGSGSLNPDALSLNLQFASDKTLTARRGPTPVFTRSSANATYLAPQLSIDGYLLNSAYQSVDAGYPYFDVSYETTRWKINKQADEENIYTYYAADGNELTPDKADWSSSGSSPVERTSSSLIYFAPINYARFDHEPLTASSKGLLIEESRTNQIKYSTNSFSNPYWETTASNVTIINSVGKSPTGIINSSGKLTEIAGVAVSRHIHETTGVFTPTANTAYTMSVWVKQAESDPVRYVQLAFWIAGFGSTAYMNYDIQNGTVGTGGDGITASSITAYPNGWYRVTATATSVASPAASGFQLGFSTSSSAARTEAYTVTSPLKSIYLWGAQVEQGSFATSYIPTTTTSLTRSVDVCSITGTDFTGFTKLGEGSVVVHGDSYQGTTPAFCQFSNDSNGARSFNFLRNASTGALDYNDSGSGTVTVSASPSFPVKFGAGRNQATGMQGFYNGTIGAGSAFTTNNAQTRMLIGNSGSGSLLNGCIRSIQHYKKRLSAAKMQALTAP
jgi:hypothetical protein